VKSAWLKRFFRSEIGAAVLWVMCSLVAAAMLSPWLYQGGRCFAELNVAGRVPASMQWIAESCGRAKFERYFSRSLLISALVLLPFLSARIRHLRASADFHKTRFHRYRPLDIGLQFAVAAMTSGVLLWLLGMYLSHAGAYTPKENVPGFGKLVSKVFLPALGASVVEEWLFRGVLLGLWLRYSKPPVAVLGTSMLFAFLHFLTPPGGTVTADPAHPLAGVRLLGLILLHFTNPLFFVAEFASLVAIGVILAWARLKTGALWFSIGLHAGWIVAFKAYNQLHVFVPGNALHPWWIGDSLKSGLLPLATLALTAVACRFVLPLFDKGLNPASR
jgi:membrane protease YdiL (CAAX protease family)